MVLTLACVASVSVEQRAKNKKNGAGAKIRRRGGGEELRKRFQPSFVNLKYSFRRRPELLIGWAGRTLFTFVNQRP